MIAAGYVFMAWMTTNCYIIAYEPPASVADAETKHYFKIFFSNEMMIMLLAWLLAGYIWKDGGNVHLDFTLKLNMTKQFQT